MTLLVRRSTEKTPDGRHYWIIRDGVRFEARGFLSDDSAREMVAQMLAQIIDGEAAT